MDLFSLKHSEREEEEGGKAGGGGGAASVLQSLPELWDEAEYAEEYDLSQYIANLKQARV